MVQNPSGTSLGFDWKSPLAIEKGARGAVMQRTSVLQRTLSIIMSVRRNWLLGSKRKEHWGGGGTPEKARAFPLSHSPIYSPSGTGLWLAATHSHDWDIGCLPPQTLV
jgi:hypothetical protein